MLSEFIAGTTILSGRSLKRSSSFLILHCQTFPESLSAFTRKLLFNPKEQTDNNNYSYTKTKRNMPDDKTVMFCVPA